MRSELHEATLTNGLKVVVETIPNHPLVAVHLRFHVGSKDEKPGKTGFAHLFEHLLFEGSAHVPENDHFRQMERVGGYVNGSTWFDRTIYYEIFPAEALPLALYLESDRMGWFLPALTEEKLANQKEVVKNERRWRVDNQPYGIWDERLFELAFPQSHPYHHPVIGSMEDVDNATLTDAETFFKTYYTPANCVLAISGGISFEEAIEQVEHWFGEIPAMDPPDPMKAAPAVLKEEVMESRPEDAEFARHYVLYHLPPFGSRQSLLGEVTATILGEGLRSRLYERMVLDTRTALDAAAWLFPLELGSVLIFRLTLEQETPPERGMEIFDETLASLASQPPDEREVARARHQMERQHLADMDNLTERVELLAMGKERFNDPAWAFKRVDEIASVRAEEMVSFIQSKLLDAHRAVLTFIPTTLLEAGNVVLEFDKRNENDDR